MVAAMRVSPGPRVTGSLSAPAVAVHDGDRGSCGLRSHAATPRVATPARISRTPPTSGQRRRLRLAPTPDRSGRTDHALLPAFLELPLPATDSEITEPTIPAGCSAPWLMSL